MTTPASQNTFPQAPIRKPAATDVQAITALIDEASGNGMLLPRPVTEVVEFLRDFHVYIDNDKVAGCCALHLDTAKLAEIRSLVVAPGLRGKGAGKALVEACLAEARRLGIPRVYALTRSASFFERRGFYEIDKHDLPQKVFKDCVRCPKFPDCDEVAMIYDIANRPEAGKTE